MNTSNYFNNVSSIVIIIILFFIFFYSLYLELSKKRVILSKIAPSILVSIGIFGTFLGIYIAVQSFNTSGNETSFNLNTLIVGVRTSVVTSVVAIFLSIIYRLIQSMVRKDENLFNELVDCVNKINTNTINLYQTLNTESNALRSNIDKFEEVIVKKSCNAFTDALVSVMKDFNGKFIEQIGDNFGRFNDSVGRIHYWQIQYKEDIEKIRTIYNEQSNRIIELNNSFTALIDGSQNIPRYLADIAKIAESISSQTEQLEQSLRGFVELKEKAVNSLPFIEQKIDNLKDSFCEKSEVLFNTIESSLSESVKILTRMLRDYSDFDEKAKKNQENADQWFSNLRDQWITLNSNTRSTIDTLVTASAQLSQKIENSSIEKISEKISNFIVGFGDLQSDLLKSFGNGLVLKAEELNNLSSNAIKMSNDAAILQFAQYEKKLDSQGELFFELITNYKDQHSVLLNNFTIKVIEIIDEIALKITDAGHNGNNILKKQYEEIENEMKINGESFITFKDDIVNFNKNVLNDLSEKFFSITNEFKKTALDNIIKNNELVDSQYSSLTNRIKDQEQQYILLRDTLESFQEAYNEVLRNGQKEREIVFAGIKSASDDAISRNKNVIDKQIKIIEENFTNQIHETSQKYYEIVLSSFIKLLKDTMRNVNNKPKKL